MVPDHPAGPFAPCLEWSEARKESLIEQIAAAPQRMHQAVAGLSEDRLDTKYKNWTIRQIVHHVADSHVHSYIRFKWTLAEDNPTIKAYEEADWVVLPDAQHGEIAPALGLLQGIHQKWTQVLKTMNQSSFERTFVHPQSGETVSLWSALNYYPWHIRHHTGQILWLREQNHW
jgi:hypothetical protein